ncbi:unnamed protein product [Phaeothamnion confervicola]
MRPAAKKRRRGVAKVKAPQKNHRKFIKPNISDERIRELWDNKKSQRENGKSMGILLESKNAFPAQASLGDEEVDSSAHPVFGVPNSDRLRDVDRNPRRRPMSEADQQYAAAQLAKHGEDHAAMARDIKTNYMQLPRDRLARLCALFLGLKAEDRMVPVPAASAAAKGAAPV